MAHSLRIHHGGVLFSLILKSAKTKYPTTGEFVHFGHPEEAG